MSRQRRVVAAVAAVAAALMTAPAAAGAADPVAVANAAWPGSPCTGQLVITFDPAVGARGHGEEAVGIIAHPDRPWELRTCDLLVDPVSWAHADPEARCLVLVHGAGHLDGRDHAERGVMAATPERGSVPACMTLRARIIRDIAAMPGCAARVVLALAGSCSAVRGVLRRSRGAIPRPRARRSLRDQPREARPAPMVGATRAPERTPAGWGAVGVSGVAASSRVADAPVPGVPPRACTTAAAVRREALEPAMELIAIDAIEARYRAQQLRALERQGALAKRRVELLRRQAAFLDRSAARLAHAEQNGSYDSVRVVSESSAGREVAGFVVYCVDTLASDALVLEHDRCREYLHDVFALHGPAIFEQRIAYHVGAHRMLVVNTEWDQWRASEAA